VEFGWVLIHASVSWAVGLVVPISSPGLTTADILLLGGSPWSRTRDRYFLSMEASALTVDLILEVLPLDGAVSTPPPHVV